ncbi:MAG: ABC transporter substrate-binding protein [Burkholderiaceae bacterium]|jgi:branched-chain amino acid transport system substrate-binding protein|nr:ABC transporter substrate-binding protein [Burkholderiaceae bacterium]
MKFRQIALGLALATGAMTGVLGSSAVSAQEKVQFFPSLTGRTGPVAPNATPFANGYADYMKLVNARGGINGVMTLVEECETAYATDRGVECYERLKGKHGGATVFQPLSTGITFALTEKVPTDKIPMITSGYGRSDSADGDIFKWNFPLIGHYWVAGDTVLQHIANKEGGWDKLKGKKIAVAYHDSPFGKELLPIMEERAKKHGFQLQLLPIPAPGVEQKAIWLQVRQQRPDYVVLQTWGVMTPTAIREAIAVGYPREKMFGTWWSGAEPDLRDVGAAAKGYSAVMMQHGAEPQSDVVKQILSSVHDKGQGTGPRNEVGQVLYMRGVVGAMLATEGARAAQVKFGKGKPVTPEQARWGYENLKLTQADLDALGFKGVMRPVATTCSDHMGSAWARVHTWDGAKFVWASDWLQADKGLIDPMVKASAEKYAAEKKMTRRTKEDCQP